MRIDAWAAALSVASPPMQMRWEKAGSQVSAHRRKAARLPKVRMVDSTPWRRKSLDNRRAVTSALPLPDPGVTTIWTLRCGVREASSPL